MIKTNIHKPARPEVQLIILGVLKGYLDNAEDFMTKVMESKKEIAKKISQESPKYPGDFLNLISMVTALYSELKKDIDIEMALVIQ